jgi:uncharacterized protein YjbI with pentapeptide repeats
VAVDRSEHSETLRAGVTVLLVGIILVMLLGVGLVFWPPRFEKPDAQAAFGASLATGAAISLAFFVLQNENQANQDRLSREQTLRLSIAMQDNLAHADLRHSELGDLDLAGKNLSGADLEGVKLHAADLTGTKLVGARLNGADLSGADLTDANLTGAHLAGIDLRGAELRRAILKGAIVGGPAQRGPTLAAQADLRGASLRDAHLADVCLAHADLRGARLGGADLQDAVLTGADLRGAHVQDDGVYANLRHVAGLRFAKVDGRNAFPAQPRPGAVPPVAAPADARSDRIAAVSDGDTFRLASGRWVRLIGVNAWEENDPQGVRATAFLRSLLRHAPGIRFTLGKPKDESFRNKLNPPGRLRAFVWLADGRFLNELLLAQGYTERAYPDPRHSEDPSEGGFQAVFNAARDQARDAGIGVWSTCRAI